MDDFDRSFEFFEKHDSLSPFRNSNFSTEEINLDHSIESSHDDPSGPNNNISFSSPVPESFQPVTSDVNGFRGKQQAEIRIHEQVSALYDDFSQDGSIAVTGTIYLQTPLPSMQLNFTNTQYIQRIEERPDVSQVLQRDDAVPRGLNVVFPKKGMATHTEIPVANFYCIVKARPVPLLVKRKINVLDGFVRVGFKVRTNPHNDASLKSLYIVMAIPPDVEGDKCKMSVKGGSWNEMKRTLTWLIKELAPGKALEIQAQFPSVNSTTYAAAPKFPILVKAIYDGLYSELSVESADANCSVKVRTTTCLLHRKV